MKQFLLNIFRFFILLSIPVLLIISSTRVASSKIDWMLPKNKHILFMGASHIVYAVDDSKMSGCINLASLSERYMYTYIKLQHILMNNNQVDTVFLECAPNDLSDNADEKYFLDNEMIKFYAIYYPLFHKEQWIMYLKKIGACSSLLFRETFINYIEGIDYSYFIDGYIANRQVLQTTKSITKNNTKRRFGNQINTYYLRQIANLCKSKGIKLYLLFCPHYKPENYYDLNTFYKSYYHMFNDIELIDYCHFINNQYDFCDEFHLNQNGANKFTKELKKRFHI